MAHADELVRNDTYRNGTPRGGLASVNIVCVNAHPIVLEGLSSLFRREPGFRVVDTFTDVSAAGRLLRRADIDVVIVDSANLAAVAREIETARRKTRMVLLAERLHEGDALETFRLGVRGVVLERVQPRLIAQCVRVVSSGGRWIERHSAGRALDRLAQRQERRGRITPRERDVARLAAAGMRNQEIAERLRIGVGTVKMHLHSVFSKLGLKNRVQLSNYAREHDLH